MIDHGTAYRCLSILQRDVIEMPHANRDSHKKTRPSAQELELPTQDFLTETYARYLERTPLDEHRYCHADVHSLDEVLIIIQDR
ncbi:hypothetical protein KIN20_000597 [Parelaphostrongylus tenuis]|uniref:Uncharacterized protein n=1 Tax=Parelaphostrongylus tenuis TaxID=148309 RepID=A0AAD5QE00_PARTN|nr:hypothetical protein KIN20_000597 [Parelaphostrongylus tenuis]